MYLIQENFWSEEKGRQKVSEKKKTETDLNIELLYNLYTLYLLPWTK